ncbi:uncharacterized protein LOC107828009 isoform X1 [Nicotiana tabacum]|uniref:Uncharacterized protein LOC107828009 isoform X1 n=3 Tax=Nicotiana TaxID=4085 RepID=A0A1S4DBD7_TOBAC|nr:PREDICTED: uncharacterized protein LOC104236360 [Nicotiana sylvestris]XP_016510747.1 PREDICTED: uncharacterized protein LOC107828009 [Nicotiana tabacum]
MDNQRTTLLNWAYFYQGKSMDELRQTLLLTTLELENTRLKAQEELKMRDDEIIQLKDLLNRAINDKNEAQEKCQTLVLEKLLLQQQQHQQLLQQQFQQTGPILSGVSSIEDEPRNNGFSSSDCDESIVSSPILDSTQQPHLAPQEKEPEFPIIIDKPLPENGKFLQAVMKAGPLLQTLLVAGPLPQWRHPPPPMDSYEIPPPPVVIPSQDPIFNAFNNCGRLNKKRGGGLFDDSDSSIGTKYLRVVL